MCYTQLQVLNTQLHMDGGIAGLKELQHLLLMKVADCKSVVWRSGKAGALWAIAKGVQATSELLGYNSTPASTRVTSG